MRKLRTPIVCVAGHVDHGKTTLLDRIRGGSVAAKEAGGITQHIGATEVPLAAIRELCGGAMESLKVGVSGLLFIDTPGHQAFTTLRSRGSSLSDIAILVIDVTEGFKPQTFEMVKILKRYQTPFVVAANKIDRTVSWNARPGRPFMESYAAQPERARQELDNRLYALMGKFSDLGLSADRYDRVRDFQRNVCIVPVSAKTGEGIPDLLLVLIGLAQRFLESELGYDESAAGRGTILEVKEERGLGPVVDVILWDGTIRRGDTVVVATGGEPAVTKVRALLRPPQMGASTESGLVSVEAAAAAAGVRIAAPGLERALPGLPLVVAGGDVGAAVEEVRSHVAEMKLKTDAKGVLIKADTLGALEALVAELRAAEVPVQKAEVGEITRRDVAEAAALRAKEPLLAAVLGFNAKSPPDVQAEAARQEVPLFVGDIIYSLIEEYKKWAAAGRERMEGAALGTVVRPAKIRLLPDCVFRVSKPAIVGVRVLGGVLRPGATLLRKDGREVGSLKSVQKEGKSVPVAHMGEEVAVSIAGPTVGRQIKVGDTLYADLPEQHVRVVRRLAARVTPDELEVLEETVQLKRKALNNKMWGMG